MKKINLGAFIPFIIFIGIGLMFAYGMWGKRVSKDDSPLIGKPEPVMQNVLLDNSQYSISSEKGKPVLVNFFASWCAPCRAENAKLVQMANQGGVKIIGVAYRDDPKDTKNYLDELGNPYDKVIVDRQGATASAYGLTGVPETYVIGADGIIKYKHKGGITDKDEPKILQIANGK